MNALRLLVTAVAVWYVVGKIRFHDYLTLKSAGRETVVDPREIRSLEPAGPQWRIVWADGHVSLHPGSVERHEGFLSLFENTHKPLFILMVLATLIPMFLMAFRWWLLLRGHGFRASFGQIFYISYSGAFFNNFLPGSVGGDLTKAILAASGEERKATIAGTVILDRAIGMVVMVATGAVCLTPYLGRFKDPSLAWLLYGLLGASVVGYALYLSPPVRRLLALLPFQKAISELDDVFRSVREKRVLASWAAGVSVLTQVASILGIYGLARAMGIPGIGLWMFFIFEPIIFIVTALPFSMGGWGVQEEIYRKLFWEYGGVDFNQAIALSVLYKLSLILASLPGGLLFALGFGRRPAAEPAPAGSQG